MSTLQAEVRLIESVPPTVNPFQITYKKYQLANGLTVILHPDPNNPLVHVDVTYHVGSAREIYGRSGYAHLFEHMMFEGSKHVAHGEHFRLITQAGGTLNGSTSRDRTNYYQTVPKNHLETVLWLESDRMGFFLEALDQKKFEVQLATVKNEREQRYDNRPYGLVWERLSEAMYPPTHSYSWMPIGYVDDLDAASLSDIQQFFNRFYGPNNAVLTIGGDIDEAETLALVSRYFGDIVTGPNSPNMPKIRPVLEQNRVVVLPDALIQVPQLVLAFPGVSALHEQEPALDCVAYLLGEGQGSVLYQALVKSGIAVDLSVFNDTSELTGEFVISAMGYAGQSLDAIYNALLPYLNGNSLEITQDMVDRFKAKMRRQFVSGLESVEKRVRRLALYETFFGTPNLTPLEYARYDVLTVAQVREAYDTFIKSKPAVILYVVPSANHALAPTQNYVFPVRPEREDLPTASLRINNSTVDRHHPPMPQAPPVLKPLRGERAKIGDIPVLIHRQDRVPMVRVEIQFKGGQWLADTAGITPAVGRVLTDFFEETSQVREAEAYHKALDRLGSTVSWSWERENLVVEVVSFPDTFAQTMTLLSDQVLKPAFLQEDLARIKRQLQEELRYKASVPAERADETLQEWLFGTHNPLSGSLDGTLDAVVAVQDADVRAFYEMQMQQKLASVVMVGSVPDTALPALSTFLTQLPVGSDTLQVLSPLSNTPSIVIVDMPGAVQAEIRVGYMAMPYDGLGPFYQASIMNFLLGGTFNSRLNMKLREEKAVTYGAHSYFSGSQNPGPYVMTVAVKGSAAAESLQDIMAVLQAYQENPLTEEEMGFTRSAVLQREALRYETQAQQIDFLSRIQTFDLPMDIQQQRATWLQTVTPEILLSQAKKMNIPAMSVVIVGDRKQIEPQVRALSLPWPIVIR